MTKLDIVDARTMLFAGGPCPLTGKGTDILLLDDGIAPADARHFGQRLSFAFEGTEQLPAGDERHHAFRGASLCAEGPEARAFQGGPLGIAPGARVLSANYAGLVPDGLQEAWEGLRRGGRRVDVVAHAYSAPDGPHLRPARHAEISRMAETHSSFAATTFAAAGHDGTAGVRFPACCDGVIAVGVSDPDGRPSGYCSRSRDGDKPELLVPDLHYRARLPDGALDSLNGTSAAVAIAAGVAALWCERLRADGLEPTPALLRALILGTGTCVPGQRARLLAIPPALSQGASIATASYDPQSGVPKTFRLRARARGTLRVAVGLKATDGLGLWFGVPPRCELTVERAGTTARDKGRGWGGVAIDVEKDDIVLIRCASEGRVDNVALMATGGDVDALEPLPISRPASRFRRDDGPIVVGVSASHDASACLMRDGKLEHAVQLERITRIRRDGRPFLSSRLAIDYCLEASGLRVQDVDLFAFNCQPLLPGYVGLSQPVAERGFSAFDPFGERSLFVSHHLAHAFSAFYGSPFTRAAVLVADGSGGSTVGEDDLLLRGPQLRAYLDQAVARRPSVHVQSVYRFTPEGYELLDREYAESFNVRCGSSSLGEVYAAVSQYIFDDWREGGKLMGLAPYGRAEAEGDSFLARDEAGRLQFRADWKQRHLWPEHARDPMTERHLASRVQDDLVTALVDRARRIPLLAKERCLAYTGGLALNSVANEAIRADAGLDSLYVLPASSDAGISIGAAAAAHFALTGRLQAGHLRDDFFGYGYRERDYENAIEEFGARLRRSPASIPEVVNRLVAGQVVGWFEGGSEFGPRALGHRSILADPRSEKMWRHINRRVKFREDFRPFAPVVLEESAATFFEMSEPSPYMLRVVRVRDEYRRALGAVTHVDGTARVQTVGRDRHPRLHALLTEFGRRTGLPILINTSLNVRGQPVVETPTQAIEMLLGTHLDALVLAETLVERQPAPGSSGPSLRAARFVLAAKVHLAWELHEGRQRAKIVAGLQGGREVGLAPWMADLLVRCDGTSSVGELVDGSLPPQVSQKEALDLFAALCELRLLVVVGETHE